MPIPCEKGLTSKLSGRSKLAGFFDTWVKKNSVIGEELTKTFTYQRMYRTLDYGLGKVTTDIYAYDGEGDIDWARDESCNVLPNLRHVCTLKTDLSGLQQSLRGSKGTEGQDFWRVHYNESVSVAHLHPSGADIRLYLSGNPA